MNKAEIIKTLKELLEQDVVINDDVVYNHISEALEELMPDEWRDNGFSCTNKLS